MAEQKTAPDLRQEDTTPKWYVVHTYSGYENKVAKDLETVVENRRLQDVICEVKVPVEMVPEIKNGKERLVEHKLFPGYVLVKMSMNPDTWYVVRNTRGVTGFVGTASDPIPLSQAEVDRLGVETAELSVDYKVGDNVEIIRGAMEGYVGVVQSIDLANNSVKIMISMLGRDTPAEAELDQVRPL